MKGWTADAVRRHTKWLYGVESDELDGDGYAVTLTMLDCPVNSGDFHRVRRAFVKRMQRLGVIRLHWVVEWQRRKVPHLHCALYFQDDGTVKAGRIITAWLDCAEAYRPGMRSQDVKRIDGALGWLKYLSKHAARGVRHYQRAGKPAGWEKTGRLWGHVGVWPEVEALRFDVSTSAGYRYRRLVRAWTIANARAEGDWRRVAWARRMLKCSRRDLSYVRGVSGWVPDEVTLSIVGLLYDDGMGVIQREE